MQTNVTSRVIKSLLDRYYPKREITVTSNDPCYITPAVKALLWRKNQWMHARCIDEAGTLARRVRNIITRHNTKWLHRVSTRKNARDAWQKVPECLGRSASAAATTKNPGLRGRAEFIAVRRLAS